MPPGRVLSAIQDQRQNFCTISSNRHSDAGKWFALIEADELDSPTTLGPVGAGNNPSSRPIMDRSGPGSTWITAIFANAFLDSDYYLRFDISPIKPFDIQTVTLQAMVGKREKICRLSGTSRWDKDPCESSLSICRNEDVVESEVKKIGTSR